MTSIAEIKQDVDALVATQEHGDQEGFTLLWVRMSEDQRMIAALYLAYVVAKDREPGDRA